VIGGVITLLIFVIYVTNIIYLRHLHVILRIFHHVNATQLVV